MNVKALIGKNIFVDGEMGEISDVRYSGMKSKRVDDELRVTKVCRVHVKLTHQLLELECTADELCELAV